MQLLKIIKTKNRNQQTVLEPNMPWSLYKVVIDRNKEMEEAIAFWAKAVMNSTRDGDNFFRAVDPDIAPWEKGNIMWNW